MPDIPARFQPMPSLVRRTRPFSTPVRWLAVFLLAGLLLLPAARAPHGAAAAGPFAYITNSGASSVSVVDTSTNTVVATIPVGFFPYGVAVNAAGTRVYVVNEGAATVMVIDTATNLVIATIPAGANPIGIAVNPAGTLVYVTNDIVAGTVTVIDTATNVVTATIPVGVGPFGVAANPVGGRVYVANSGSNTVSVIDPTTNTVIVTVASAGGPEGIAINAAGTRVYVTNNSGGTLTVIDTATNMVVATTPVGTGPLGVTVNPAGTRVYIANLTTPGAVRVVDTTTNTVLATVTVGPNPTGISITPSGARVYTASNTGGSTSVIDTGSTTVVATVALGGTPVGFGQFIGGPVTATTSSTTLVSSRNPSPVGQSVTFTATVTCAGFTPTGTVTFKDGAPALGTSALSSTDGVTTATLTTSTLAGGSHPITATYAGDANRITSISTVLTQVVNAVTAGTTLVSSANPSTIGQSVTFTATVSCAGFTPTGTVNFKDGAATLGTSTLTTTVGVTTATFSTSALAIGSHSITASHAGDGNCTASTSTALTQVVTALSASGSLSASRTLSSVGQSVTFTATVACAAATPTGSVSFFDGTTNLGNGTLSTSSGVTTAMLTTATLVAGNHSITASYAGNASCPASTSDVLVVMVSPPSVSTTDIIQSGIAGQTTRVSFNVFIGTLCTLGTTFRASIDWGDGTSSPGLITGRCGVGDGTALVAADAATTDDLAEANAITYAASGTFTVSGEHIYASLGTYLAVATIFGSDGLTAAVTVTVQISPAAQLVLPGPRVQRFIGVTLRLNIVGCGTVNGDAGTVSGDRSTVHQVGELVTLTAIPCTGSSFVSWSGGGPGCDGRTVSQCVAVIPGSDLAVTATFALIANPAPAGSTTQALNRGCNDVLTAAGMNPNTSVVTLASLVQGTAVTSIWRFDNSRHAFVAGYFSNPAAPVEFSSVSPLQALFICVQAPGSLPAAS